MKKYLFLILGIILISSCVSNTDVNVKDPQKETTVQLQNLAKIDTNYYKVVEQNDVVYILQKDIVVKKVKNDSGAYASTIICVFLFGMLCIILLIFID